MSDTPTPITDPTPAPVTAPPAPASEQAPTDQPQVFDAEYVGKLRQENARYRQRAQLLEGLDPDSQAAIEALAQGVRAGDPDQVREWVTRQYEAFQAAEQGRPVRGDQGRYDSPRPVAPIGRPQPAPDDDPDRPLTAGELLKVLDARDRQLTAAQQRQAAAEKLNAEFRELGIDPGSALGAAVARKAMLMKGELGYAPAPAEAHRALMADLAAAGLAPAPVPAAGGAPGVPATPSGVPGQVDPMAGLTPQQRAERRMAEYARQGLLGGS